MRYSRYLSTIAAIGDFLILNFLFVFIYCYQNNFGDVCNQTNAVIFYFYINFAWIITVSIFRPYKVDRVIGKKFILFTYIKSVIFLLPLFLLYFQVFTFNYLSREEIKFIFPVFLAALLVWRFSLYFILSWYRKAGYNYRNVVIIGNNETANDLKNYFMQTPWTGYRFKGFFTQQQSNKKDVVGTYNELEQYVVEHKIDELYLVSNHLHDSVFKVISSIVSKYPVKIRIVPDVSQFRYMSVKLVNYDSIPVLKIQRGPLSFWYNRFFKRFFDIFLSLIIIVFVLSWLIPLIWFINFLSGDSGNPFFVQHRTGLDNKPFKMIKFRTMKKNMDADVRQATKNDERITRIGRVLRKTSIDELPQFFNVLAGNMTVVGPRPHMLNHTDLYKELVKEFMIRHSVKPGITGYAQVRGKRGEIKRTRDIKERIKLDLYYIENWSFMLDLKIIFLTVLKILKGDKAAY